MSEVSISALHLEQAAGCVSVSPLDSFTSKQPDLLYTFYISVHTYIYFDFNQVTVHHKTDNVLFLAAMDDPYAHLDLDNEERTYVALHDTMVSLYKNQNKQAFRIATQLLPVSVTYPPTST
jgi:hypothetical protein